LGESFCLSWNAQDRTMNAVTYEISSADNDPRDSEETGWRRVSTGLMLVLGGDIVLLAGGVLGLVGYWLALPGAPLEALTKATGDSPEAGLLPSALTAGLGALCGYALILAGQWRCQKQFPGGGGARALMAVSLGCFVVGLVLLVLAPLEDRARNYLLLAQGADGLERVAWWTPAGTMLLIGLAVFVWRFLLFNQFLRSVASCFADRRQVRMVDTYLALVCLLLGATIGILLCFQHLPYRTEILRVIALGWLACFVGQVYLLDGTRMCIAKGLARAPCGEEPGDDPPTFVSIPQRLSGMHRLFRARFE
jgi:hypothetical protein